MGGVTLARLVLHEYAGSGNCYKIRLTAAHVGAANAFLAGGRFSVADIVLYAYTHTCEEGGYRLADYPALQAWLARVAAQPGHVAFDWPRAPNRS